MSCGGCTDLGAVKACTKAGTSCGSCLPLVKQLMSAELEKSGITVSTALCEHFELSRAQLFDVVRVTGLRSFSDIIAAHGTGRGLRHLPAGDRLDPVLARRAATCWTPTRPGCRTPTTT